MERYAGRPLSKKLGVKEGLAVTLLGAPPGFDETLGPLPAGVRLRRKARGSADLIVLFARSRAVLERRFAPATRCLRAGGSIWLAWPKRASGVATDLTQTDVRRYGLDRSLVDYKICSIDDTWSGLRVRAPKGRDRRMRRLAAALLLAGCAAPESGQRHTDLLRFVPERLDGNEAPARVKSLTVDGDQRASLVGRSPDRLELGPVG